MILLVVRRDVGWLEFRKYQLADGEDQDVNTMLIFLKDIRLRCKDHNI